MENGRSRTKSICHSFVDLDAPFFSFFFFFPIPSIDSAFLFVPLDQHRWIELFLRKIEKTIFQPREIRIEEMIILRDIVWNVYNVNIIIIIIKKWKSRERSNWITRLNSNDFTPRSSTLERGVVSRSCYRRSRYTVYRPSPFVTPPLRGWWENLQHLFALFSPPRPEREARREEKRSERAGEESSFVTENLLRLSIIFNRENKSFDSIIRGISSCLPRGPPTSASNGEKKKKGEKNLLFVRLKNLGDT